MLSGFSHPGNYIMLTTEKAVKAEKEKIKALKKEIIEARKKEIEEEEKEAARQAKIDAGEIEEGAEEEEEEEAQQIVIEEEEVEFQKDVPLTPRKWVSTTAEETAEEVERFTVTNSRPLIKVQLSRKRHLFGAPVKMSDGPDNTANIRPAKDQNYAMSRVELDCGIQAVKETNMNHCQTTWWRAVSQSVQYEEGDFLSNDQGFDEIDRLAAFLTTVSQDVEESLQQNETLDIFRDEFDNLGEEDLGFGSKTSSNIKEYRNFHDVTYTKNKRISIHCAIVSHRTPPRRQPGLARFLLTKTRALKPHQPISKLPEIA